MARKPAISSRISDVLSPREREIFSNLGSPDAIQDYLDGLSTNFEVQGETYYSPRRVLELQTAHCMEGAVFAAAVLAYHGEKPLLMDFQTTDDDVDHVVALFRRHGRWGAISKTNHAVLRYRDPVYKTPRELAMSYFHEYFSPDGSKSLLAFSMPFDLSQFAPERWITSEHDLGWLAGELDHSRHVPTVSRNVFPKLRHASRVEVDASFHVEWRRQGVRAKPGAIDPARGNPSD